MLRKPLGALAIAAALLAFTAGGGAFAETMKVSADLKGASETPPNESKGTGTLAGTYDSATKKLTWDITYSGLTGDGTAAHFHGPAPVGKPAGVMIGIPTPVTSPIKGEATLTDAQAKELTDGMVYFNVHTKEHPKGEIRGQVMLGK